VTALFMPLILCFTVIASVSLGVFSAYILVFGLLSLFGRNTQPKPAARPQLVLVARQTSASGD
jgi:hypothetical protein